MTDWVREKDGNVPKAEETPKEHRVQRSEKSMHRNVAKSDYDFRGNPHKEVIHVRFK